MTMSDAEVLERAHSVVFWGGWANSAQYEVAARALEISGDDPEVLSRCVELWHHYAMPVADGYSSEGPPRELGGSLLARALAASERVLARRPAVDTIATRKLTFWVGHLRALEALLAPPTADTLAAVRSRLAPMHALVTGPRLGDERYDTHVMHLVLARKLAWELLAAGAPYPEAARDRLAALVAAVDACLGWPVAPLTRDASFRAHAAEILAARAAAGSHPAPRSARGGLFIEELATRDDPEPGEIDGRLLLSLWLCGVDEPEFLKIAEEAISAYPGALERLLKLGFDCNRHTTRGETLLAVAARADGAEAVRLLIAAGGKPDRKNRRGKRESARQIATARRRGPVLAALGGEATAPAPSERAAALASTLRAAAKKLTPAKVRGMASNFGMTKPDPAEILERSLAKFPERPEDILADVASEPVFDRFVVARLLRDAGLGRDVRLTGLHILADDLTVSGDLVVEGVLVDELGKAAVVVAGDLDAHVVVSEADMLVGGELRARDFVWGNYSDGTLAVAGAITTPLLVLTNHTCECGSRAKSGRQLVDPDDDELTPLFVPTVLKDGSLDRRKVLAHLRKHAEVLRTAANKPARAKAR